MKAKITIGLLLACFCGINAQNTGMFEGDPFWSYCLYSRFEKYLEEKEFKRVDCSYNYYAIGDTLEVNGKDYYMIYRGYSSDPESRSILPPSYRSLNVGIREENGRILADYEMLLTHLQDFYYPNIIFDSNNFPYEVADNGEAILYDFTMQVGDKFKSVPKRKDIWVTNIDRIITKDEVERKIFTLNTGLKIVEGIGCINSRGELLRYLCMPDFRQFPLDELPYATNVCFLAVFSYLPTYWEDVKDIKKHIYIQPIEDVATDFVGIEHVTMDEADDTSTPLYDLLGREVIGIPEQGIYIRNKKKIWIK